jgi:hypothetical protein
MMRTCAIICLVTVAACSGSQTISGDPEAVAALRAQPAAQYAATVALAQSVANRCAVYDYRGDLGRAIDAQRAATGTNLAIARTQVTAVDLETDVATRTLLARYEVAALDGPDVCAIAAGEVARRSALGALLVSNA